MDFFHIFEDREDEIAEKKPFRGSLPEGMFDYDWNQYMSMLDTHPKEHCDTNTSKMRIGLNSFHTRPSAPMFAKMIE